jgi:16S rRNA processing protein RimM
MADRRENERVLIGAITGPHGVRGAFKVKSFAARPADLLAYGPVSLADGQLLDLSMTGQQKDLLICKASSVGDRDEAAGLRGTQLFVARNALPELAEDELYQADLIGCQVVDIKAGPLGIAAGFHDFGAGQLIEVKPERGDTIFLPFAGTAIAGIDLEQQQISLAVPDGLLAEPDAKTDKEPGR